MIRHVALGFALILATAALFAEEDKAASPRPLWVTRDGATYTCRRDPSGIWVASAEKDGELLWTRTLAIPGKPPLGEVCTFRIVQYRAVAPTPPFHWQLSILTDGGVFGLSPKDGEFVEAIWGGSGKKEPGEATAKATPEKPAADAKKEFRVQHAGKSFTARSLGDALGPWEVSGLGEDGKPLWTRSLPKGIRLSRMEIVDGQSEDVEFLGGKRLELSGSWWLEIHLGTGDVLSCYEAERSPGKR